MPIWKKEHYDNGDSGWVNCERCAARRARSRARHDATAPGTIDAHAPHCHDYSRQWRLPEVGAPGQARLRAARVLVIGAGRPGRAGAQYLAGAGIGRLGIVDGDVVEACNLHRQPLYSCESMGQPKAELAAARLRALNPDVDVQAVVLRADARTTSTRLVGGYDLVVDCTDNFRTKFLVNDACVRARQARRVRERLPVRRAAAG